MLVDIVGEDVMDVFDIELNEIALDLNIPYKYLLTND